MTWGSRTGDAQRRPTPLLHSQNTTAAKPTVNTHKPAVENRPRFRLADLFERAKPRSGPSLTGERRPLSFRDGNTQATGSVSATRDSVTVRAGGSAEVKGLKISSRQVNSTSNVESKDGFTTLTATGSMSVNLGGEVDLGAVGFGGNITEGVKTKYQLRMSDADYAKVRSGQAPMPDPYNPDTMPAGSSVLLNSTDFQNTGFEASYRNLKLDTNVSQEQGLSVAVEKRREHGAGDGGPTEAVGEQLQLGLSLGPASAHIGNTTRLDRSNSRRRSSISPPTRAAPPTTRFSPPASSPRRTATGSQRRDGGEAPVRLDDQCWRLAGALERLGRPGQQQPEYREDDVPGWLSGPGDGRKLHAGTPVHLEQHFKPDGAEDFSKQKIRC